MLNQHRPEHPEWVDQLVFCPRKRHAPPATRLGHLLHRHPQPRELPPVQPRSAGRQPELGQIRCSQLPTAARLAVQHRERHPELLCRHRRLERCLALGVGRGANDRAGRDSLPDLQIRALRDCEEEMPVPLVLQSQRRC